MVSEWSVIEQRNILEGPKINLPPEAQEVVVGENDDQELVWWHHEKHANYAVISNTLLRKPDYEFLDTSEILYSDTPTNVTIPKKVRDELTSSFSYGDKLFYLAYKEMTRGDTRSVFILTERQLLRILPDSTAADSNLEQAIANAPGFMPSV